MRRFFRILCALAAAFTSSVFLLGINYAAHRLPIHSPKYFAAMLVFIFVGLLSLCGAFMLGLSKA